MNVGLDNYVYLEGVLVIDNFGQFLTIAVFQKTMILNIVDILRDTIN